MFRRRLAWKLQPVSVRTMTQQRPLIAFRQCLLNLVFRPCPIWIWQPLSDGMYAGSNSGTCFRMAASASQYAWLKDDCNEAAETCWRRFLKKHARKFVQDQWLTAWK